MERQKHRASMQGALKTAVGGLVSMDCGKYIVVMSAFGATPTLPCFSGES
jgi:hypothetical protein